LLSEDDWRYMGWGLEVKTDESSLDSERWKVKTYRIYPQTEKELERDHGFIIARIETDRLDLVSKAERLGYKLCDTLVYWKGKCVGSNDQCPSPGYWTRPIEPKDKEAIARLTKESFEGYKSHYFADSHTKAGSVDAYVDWATRSVDGVVIEDERCEFPYVHRNVVAYGTFGGNCELVLGGVSKDHRGKGLYEHLVKSCMNWGITRGDKEIIISTQIHNLSVQKVWAKLGLKPIKSYYTFHYWPCG
jgi:GNAT superfamily N-acetyltransferase